MSTPEGRVKDMVRKALKNLPHPFYRFMPVQNGMGSPALDFYGCYKGLFVAIETKVPGKNMTDRQKETARQIIEAGGLVFVIRNAADIAHMLDTLYQGGPKFHRLYDTCP